MSHRLAYSQSVSMTSPSPGFEPHFTGQSKSYFGIDYEVSNDTTTTTTTTTTTPLDEFASYPGLSNTGFVKSFGLYKDISSHNTASSGLFSSSTPKLVSRAVHLQVNPVSYGIPSSFMSANFTSSNNLEKYCTSDVRDVLHRDPLLPQADMVVQATNSQGSLEKVKQEDYTNNHTSGFTSSIIKKAATPSLSEKVLSEFCSELNPFEFRNQEDSAQWNKTFAEMPGEDYVCEKKVQTIDFEATGHEFQTPDHIFGERGNGLYVNQGQGHVYIPRGSDRAFSCGGQTNLVRSGEVYQQTSSSCTAMAGDIASNILTATTAYRSFSSELNSPNLSLPEDADIDFEFPLHLGLGETGFENFMSNELNRDDSGAHRSSCEKGFKHNTQFAMAREGFSSSDFHSDCPVSGNIDVMITPKIERSDFEVVLPTSEPYSNRRTVGNEEYVQRRYRSERLTSGCQFRPQYTSPTSAPPLQFGLSSQSVEHAQNYWLGCQSISDNSRNINFDIVPLGLVNRESLYGNSGEFIDEGVILNAGTEINTLRQSGLDVANFRNNGTANADFATLEQKHSFQTSEIRAESFPASCHSYQGSDRTGCDAFSKWRTCDSVDGGTQNSASWHVWEPKAACGFGVGYPSGGGSDACRSDQDDARNSFVEFSTDSTFNGFTGKNFQESTSIANDHISSTTTVTTANSGNNNSYFYDNATSNNVATSDQQNARKRPNSDSGSRALAKFIQQQNRSTECPDSNLVQSAIDHIMKNRPRASQTLTAREIFNCSLRNVKATKRMTSHVTDVADVCCTDIKADEDVCSKRKRTPKLSSEVVTTTTNSPSPPAPSLSCSPTISLTALQPYSATSLARGITSLPSSTNENCGSSNVTSSSKQEKRRPSILPPCRVCCSKASGLHYGVVTCEACNGFFRRSLKRGAIYLCSKEKKCEVNGKKRGECSHCRYQKCLSVGMSKSAVKTGRYSDKTRLAYAIETEARNKTSLFLNELHEVREMTSDLLNIHDLHVVRPACMTDMEFLEKHYKHLRQSSPQPSSDENKVKALSGYRSNKPEMPTTTFPEYLSGRGVSRMRAIILEQWLHEYMKFIKTVPGFSLLPVTDQTKLVRAAWHEIWLLEAYKDFRSELRVPTENSGLYKEIEATFGKDYKDTSRRLSARFEKLQITTDELIFIQMLCLIDSHRCQLDAPYQVKSLHWLMTQCLVRELQRNHPDEPNAIMEVQSLLADLKTTCQDLVLPSNDNKHDYSPTHDTPLLQEMLTSASR